MNPEQLAFLEYEFTTSAMLAALATRRKTHPTYAVGAKSEEKEAVKAWLRSYLIKLGKRYQLRVLSEEEHVREIGMLADEATRTHGTALHQGKFRFGVAQKIVNLYLKYLWSIGVVSTLHHCPIDGIINKYANLGYEWNTSETEADYIQAVEKLRFKIGKESLQSWEVRMFQVARSAA